MRAHRRSSISSAVWYPSPAHTPGAPPPLVRFAADSANYASEEDQLRQLGVKSVIANLDKIGADPQVRVFQQAVADTLADPQASSAAATLDPTMVAASFRGYVARDALLDAMTIDAATTLREEARQLAASEKASLLLWALGSAALALASIAIALWLSRSISRPLKELASYAHDVNEGNLDAEPSSLRSHGPRRRSLPLRPSPIWSPTCSCSTPKPTRWPIATFTILCFASHCPVASVDRWRARLPCSRARSSSAISCRRASPIKRLTIP